MFTNLKPHAAYTSSTIPWLGKHPAHWRLLPGLAVLRLVTIKNSNLTEDTVLSLSYGRIVVKSPDKLHGLVPASFDTYQVLGPGNIVVRPTDLQNDQTSIRVGIVRDRGIITSAYLGFNVLGEADPDFIYRYLATLDSMKIFYGMGSGLRQNLGVGDFRHLPILVPPLDEQAAIVKYLGHANTRIDRAIAAKRKLIALLEEQERAIINQAVTRGLDPSVPLKDSGIPWLGRLPQHWNVRRAKYLFRDIDVRSKTGLEEQLSVSHLTGVSPRRMKTITMFKAASYIGHKTCLAGDLVVNTMWAWMGALGIAREAGLVSPAYNVYRPWRNSGVNVEFVAMLFRTPTYIAYFRSHSTGVRPSRLRFYPDELLATSVVLPPWDEQAAIVKAIELLSRRKVAEVGKIVREIELLRAFKARLTADVVTGQVDIRAAAARLPELDPSDLVSDVGMQDEDEFDVELEESLAEVDQ